MDDVRENPAEFLTQHRQRIDAKDEEQRYSVDAAIEHDEHFTQPWDKAWKSLEDSIGSIYYKPGDAETTVALVEAIRRIVELAKGTAYEDCIRVATERCQRLYRRDPTGKAFHLADVADRAAILTILESALEDSASTKKLSACLRVTSPHVGESCRREVEYTGQMVTLQAGVQKQTPAADSQTATLLRDSLTRCRERLEVAAEKHRTVAVMLVHRCNLGNEAEPSWPVNYENQAHHQLNQGGGPCCDVRQLFDANGQPAVGEKPCLDVEGQPMLYSDGTPAAMYPGAMRTHSLYGKMFSGSTDADYSEAVDEYNDSAMELGYLLDGLPEAVKQTLWQDWPHGFVNHNPGDLWTNAVFELAWQELPASRLSAERFAWHENYQLKIDNLPRMRASDLLSMGMFDELVERVGDPPAFWYSWIDNLWRASIGAIDLLISMLRLSPATSDAEAIPPQANPPEQPKKRKKTTVNDRMKTGQSTTKGNTRGDSNTKSLIIAALNQHHQYSNGRCKHAGHVGVNKLARHLKLSPSTVSGFFKTEFGGHDKYKIACGDLGTLANALRILNGELTPSILFKPLGDNAGNLADE